MYKEYDSYKHIDENWLHRIPEHWSTAFLSSLFDEHKLKESWNDKQKSSFIKLWTNCKKRYK